MIKKYCWICGKYFPENEIEPHKDEHYQEGNKRKREYLKTHSVIKEEKPFNTIRGLEKLKEKTNG